MSIVPNERDFSYCWCCNTSKSSGGATIAGNFICKGCLKGDHPQWEARLCRYIMDFTCAGCKNSYTINVSANTARSVVFNFDKAKCKNCKGPASAIKLDLRKDYKGSAGTGYTPPVLPPPPEKEGIFCAAIYEEAASDTVQ